MCSFVLISQHSYYVFVALCSMLISRDSYHMFGFVLISRDSYHILGFLLISRDSYHMFGFVLISWDSYHMFVALYSYHGSCTVSLWLCAISWDSNHMFGFVLISRHGTRIICLRLCAHITRLCICVCAHILRLVPYGRDGFVLS